MRALILTLMGIAFAANASATEIASIPFINRLDSQNCCTLISHSSGGIQGNPYTNSEEALRANLALGSRIFEVDFAPTREGAWVVTHDWKSWKYQVSGNGGTFTQIQNFFIDPAPTLEEFRSIKIRGSTETGTASAAYTPLTLEYLQAVLEEYPDITFITDTKYNFQELVSALEMTPLKGHLLYQAYSLEDLDYLKSRKLPAILTLYKMDIQNFSATLKEIKKRKDSLRAITAPLQFLAENKYEKLHQLKEIGLPVLVHGKPANINSRQLQQELKTQGVNGFYLD